MAGRLNADTATDTEGPCPTSGRSKATARRMGANTVAYTAGAVACPDGASASKHQQRRDWCVHPAPRIYVRRYQL